MSRLWEDWRSALVLVQPDTVRKLIQRMSRENSLWGAPRIQAELALLGHVVAESTVAKYMVRRRFGPPSQTWRSFLKNHMDCTAACDFFVVPTATFRLLYCFVVLMHGRRRIVHFNVTTHPTADWTAQQIVEAFPADGGEPRYLLRDRDSIYGDHFRQRVHNMGIRQILISPRSAWQNPYVERVIGSVRRECLDHVVVFNENHLRRVLKGYLRYYHVSRTHLALGKDAPDSRSVEPPTRGKVVAFPEVGGLHHRYTRRAA